MIKSLLTNSIKKIYILISLTIILFISASIFTLVINSAFYNNIKSNENIKKRNTIFTVVPLSKELELSGFINGVNDILKETGATFFPSHKLDKTINSNGYVIIDKDISNNYIWAIRENDISKTKKISSIKEIKEKAKIEKSNNLINNTDKFIFFECQKLEFNDLYFYKLDSNEVDYLFNELNFSQSEIKSGVVKRVLDLNNKTDSAKIAVQISKNENEVIFILKYVFPYITMLFCFLIASFKVYYKDIFIKKEKEDYILIMSGEDLRAIFVKNTIFNLIAIIISFILFLVLNRFKFNAILYINISMLLVLFLILEIILFKTCNDNNRRGKTYD